MIEKARAALETGRRDTEQALSQIAQETDAERRADLLFREIYNDGMAVIEQHSKPPLAAETLSERLRSLVQRTHFFGSYKYGRSVYTVVEGQPGVSIWLDERIGRGSKQLRILLGGIEDQLIVGIDKKGLLAWEIMVPDEINGKMEPSWEKRYKKPLESAQEWRCVMDAVLERRPIHRVIPARVN